jgi:hypothetical protein
MAGSTQEKQPSDHPGLSGSRGNQAARDSSSWSRDDLMHPTVLPLGFAIGCCLGLVTAVIAFF